MIGGIKQTYRPMEPNRAPRNKATHIQSTELQHSSPEYIMRKLLSFQYIVFGKHDAPLQNNETGPLSYTMHKNQLQVDDILNVRPETVRHLEENKEETFMTLV